MLETKRIKDLQTHLITSDEWRQSMKEHGVAPNRFWDAANALVTKGMVVQINDGYKSQAENVASDD